jgi:uncharacterized protein (DUF2267 family)
MARNTYTIRGKPVRGWVASNRREFPDEGEFKDAGATPQEIQAALDIIRRMHPSDAAKIASQLPVSWQELLTRREVQDELGESRVFEIQNLVNRYPDRRGEQAALRIMRATLYEKW